MAYQLLTCCCIIGVFYHWLTRGVRPGALTPPPGAPSPTMKTLDQVEPRTAITNLPFTINQGGSYYSTQSYAQDFGANAINDHDQQCDARLVRLHGPKHRQPDDLDGISAPWRAQRAPQECGGEKRLHQRLQRDLRNRMLRSAALRV